MHQILSQPHQTVPQNRNPGALTNFQRRTQTSPRYFTPRKSPDGKLGKTKPRDRASIHAETVAAWDRRLGRRLRSPTNSCPSPITSSSSDSMASNRQSASPTTTRGIPDSCMCILTSPTGCRMGAVPAHPIHGAGQADSTLMLTGRSLSLSQGASRRSALHPTFRYNTRPPKSPRPIQIYLFIYLSVMQNGSMNRLLLD